MHVFGVDDVAKPPVRPVCGYSKRGSFCGSLFVRTSGSLLVGAEAFARQLDGTVSFGGELLSLSDDERLRLPGRTARVIVQDGDRTSGYVISDARFLESWLEHDRFRMVK